MVHTPGTILGHRFEVLAPIGQGGMGAVYKARDILSGDFVAVKQMIDESDCGFERPEMRERFDKEARTLAELDHPRIPRLILHFTQGDSGYYVMEFVEGMSLDKLLDAYRQRKEPFPEILMIDYALQILEVLDYLHNSDRTLIHRDVKPQNIIVRKEFGDLVLVDFGLARDTASASTKTLVGTLGYAPLEQVKGHPEPRSDLYALGATMFHLLSGGPPAPFQIPPLVKARPDVSPGLAAIVDRACQDRAEQRFSSAVKMEHALRRLRYQMTAQPDPRLDELQRNEFGAPPSGRFSGEPGPLSTPVFLSLVLAGSALVLILLWGVGRWRQGGFAEASPTPVAISTPGPEEVGQRPPPVPRRPDGPPPRAAAAPVKFVPASAAQQQLTASLIGSGFALRGITGRLNDDLTMVAPPGQSAGLWFERPEPVSLSRLTFQIVRPAGPVSVQVQLESTRQNRFVVVSEYHDAEDQVVNALTVSGQIQEFGNAIRGGPDLFNIFSLASGGDSTTLDVQGLRGQSIVYATLQDINLIRVIVGGVEGHTQSARLSSVTLTL